MNFDFDVIIVGGGPSGMMASITSSKAGAKVLLIEKNENLGKKMLITGGGRCNLTNTADIEETIGNIPGNGKFIYSSLHRFNSQDLRNFLSSIGIKTKVEENGRVFPVGNSAAQVVENLVTYIKQLGVHIRCRTRVDSLLIKDGKCYGVRVGDDKIKARSVIIATGGLSYPSTGSTGDGYKMAEETGHKITPLFPAAVALNCSDPWIINKEMQGISVTGARITVLNQEGKALASETGDIIFTHWGISGPVVLKVGREVALHKMKSPSAVIIGEIDLFPNVPETELFKKIHELSNLGGNKAVKNIITGLLPERLANLVLVLSNIPPHTNCSRLNQEHIYKLADTLKTLPINIKGTRPLHEATVTGGGISIKEINPRTMESKIVKGLFFAGEIIDVDAHTGGFNMQIAFSTGFIAGHSAVELLRQTIDLSSPVGVN